MIKVGTLQDFQAALKKLKKAGVEFEVEKTPNDLVREVWKDKERKELILSITRYSSGTWFFNYNKKYWQESQPDVKTGEPK